MKKILFISRQPPYGSFHPREALDALLAATAYEQDLGVLFMDDGVFQLLENQNPTNIYQKNLGASLKALEFYDVENIYVDAQSLAARNINQQDLLFDSVKLLDTYQVNQLMAQQDQLISF